MNRCMSRAVLLFLVFLLGVSVVFADSRGVKKKRPRPDEYGNVVLNNFAVQKDMQPVVFNHWLHRAEYTCRVCHVDVGFAMEVNGTGIKMADNNKGFYCGAPGCHDGKEAFGPKGKNLRGQEVENCDRCHSYGKNVVFEKDFYKFTAKFPRERFGNGIDWEKAEKEGRVTLKDYLEGVSIKRRPLRKPTDIELVPQVKNMPDIIFSHQKHTIWNGCELCHPDVFRGVKKGLTKYSMSDIFDGKYCGLCHGRVAFPNFDCQRCHSKPV